MGQTEPGEGRAKGPAPDLNNSLSAGKGLPPAEEPGHDTQGAGALPLSVVVAGAALALAVPVLLAVLLSRPKKAPPAPAKPVPVAPGPFAEPPQPAPAAARPKPPPAPPASSRDEDLKVLIAHVKKAGEDYAHALEVWRNPATPRQDQAYKALSDAWAAYAGVTATCFDEMLRAAERHAPEGEDQKEAGQNIATLADDWLKKQAADGEASEPRDVLMKAFVEQVRGRGCMLAGEGERAIRDFDRAIAVDPEQFREVAERRQILVVRARAMSAKAGLLIAAAERSGKEADWRAALAVVAGVFTGEQTRDLAALAEARILRARCRARLGQSAEALDDLYKILGAAGALQEPALRDRALAEVVPLLRGGGAGSGREPAVGPEALLEAGRVLCRQAEAARARNREEFARSKDEVAVGCLRDAATLFRARFPAKPAERDWARRLAVDGEAAAWLLLGGAFRRLGQELEAQQAFEGALLAFWGEDGKAVPEFIRGRHAGPFRELRLQALVPCAEGGLAAAEAEQQRNPSKFNAAQAERWRRWRERLK